MKEKKVERRLYEEKFIWCRLIPALEVKEITTRFTEKINCQWWNELQIFLIRFSTFKTCAGMIRTFSITANVELRKAALIFGLNAQRLTVIVKRQAVYIAMMTNSKCKWSKCQSLDTLHTDDSHKQFSFWLFHHYSTLLREITFQYFVQQFGHFVLTLLSTIS